MKPAICRSCQAPLRHVMVDLGMSPLAESYVRAEDLGRPEAFYPLKVYVCGRCFLVQLEAFVPPTDIFSEYAYFSSYSDSWVAHARRYVDRMAGELGLGARSRVVEIGSNDGYLLQHFVKKGVPVLGVEPAANVAAAAVERGVPTLGRFFGADVARQMAAQGWTADLIVANNVLAQAPDVHDFVEGLALTLKPRGVATLEFPHVVRLIEDNQLDTIYHEHFSYFSLATAARLMSAHRLSLFRVETLPTHGGSLRVHVVHESDARPEHPSVAEMRRLEAGFGVERLETYSGFEEKARETKRRLLEFLIPVRREGKRVVGYGAPGKGNTLLNYCGIRADFLEFTVDRNPYKQGKFLPGTHIPILAPERLREARPEYVLILPWNLKDEIITQLAYVREWGGRFVIPIPDVQVCS